MAPEHETKYIFDNTYAQILLKWLNLRCIKDPSFPLAEISSIYYDTKDWLLLNEKINSDYYKSKFRVRWYSNIDKENTVIGADRSFVEVKYKIGATREKIRFESPYSGKQLAKMNMSHPKLLELPQEARKIGAKIPFPLYPAFQVSYKRFRFLEPKSRCRICIDYDIYAPNVNRQMLICFKPLSFIRTGVVEVKGAVAELPDTLRQLTAFGCKKQAFSKYSSCYSELTGMFF